MLYSLCSGQTISLCILTLSSFSQPSIRGVDLDKLREVLLSHCDVNKDGKIQKSELALCLGVKLKSLAH